MGWVFLIGFAVAGFYLGRVTNEPSNAPVKEMIDGNSKIIHDGDVPETYEQILKDQREIDQSLRALGFGHIFMEEALGQILEKIKESHLTNQ